MSAATDGFGTLLKNAAAAGGGGGSENLAATPGSSQGSPVGDLDLGVQVSVLINQTGGAAFWHLPDGVDGQIKEIVNGAPGNMSDSYAGITSTNGWSNDLLIINSFQSVRLVWVTALGGWVVANYCTNVNSAWD